MLSPYSLLTVGNPHAILSVGGNISITDALFSINTLYLVAGIVLLYLGAEALVAGASKLALQFGIEAAVVGVTVIAFATTTPELFVGILSGLGYSTDLGLGAVVGSNIANIGLVLGLAALIRPLSVDRDIIRQHLPFMVGAALLLVVLGFDGQIGRFDGLVLLVALGAFTAHLYRNASKMSNFSPDEAGNAEQNEAGVLDVAKVVVGLGLLLFGSRWLISGGQSLLLAFNLDQRLIGLTILAFGTSLPELATSVVSSIRNESAISIGNVVGSNIYNILAVLGILAVMVPLSVPTTTMRFDFPMLIAFTFGAIAIMLHNRDVTRLDGGMLVGGYLVFFYFLLPS